MVFFIGILWNAKIHSCIRSSQDNERYPGPLTTRPHPCNLISFTSVTTLFPHQNLCLRQAKCHNSVTSIMHDTCTKGKAIPSLAYTGLQEVLAPRISRQSADECCKVVSPTRWPPLSPRRYSFLGEAESTPGPNCGRKD